MKTASLFFLVLLSACAAQSASERRDFFQQFCTDCHDAQTKKGNLDLEALQAQALNADNLSRWVSIYDRVAAGEMPPKKKEQPAPDARAAFLGGLRGALIEAEAKHPVATVRRMNRVEFESSLRDLLHLPLLRVKDLLPEDGQQSGFDKVGGALD